MNYKREAKLIRQYVIAWNDYIRFGIARTDGAKEKQEQLRLRFESASAKLERNGIDMDMVNEYKVRNGL